MGMEHLFPDDEMWKILWTRLWQHV